MTNVNVKRSVFDSKKKKNAKSVYSEPDLFSTSVGEVSEQRRP